MNPDQNKGGVSSLLTTGTYASAAAAIVGGVLVALYALVSNADRTTFAAIAFAVGLVIGIFILIFNIRLKQNVENKLQALADVSRDFTGGDRSVRVAVNGDDVYAQLSSALNSVFDSLGSSAGSGLGAGSSDAAALQAQIEKLLQEVSAVGDGDLRVQAEVTPDTLGVLADSFNYMIEELAKVVGRVQSTAVQVTNATRRILDRSAELAQASETQVKQIAQTTEAVEALAVFIQNVARNAQLSVDVAQEALRSANNGQQAVRQTIEGMMVIRENVQETSKKIKRLGERSNEIGEIVRIIEDIADQTNLLALNAAIQSAMAGEHGRGFAVVADEIRLLAERSTESTKRIATLVKSIQGDTHEAVVAMEDSTQEVVKGSQLADEAGRSLNSIYSAVERQAQMIENIARAANEQTSVSEAVAVAMGRISEITRQTDAGTQEAAVSVSYLAELSEQLRASVSTFRLPDRTNDMLGSFAGSSAGANDFADKGFGSSLGSFGGDGNWGGQSLGGGNFPPLPEPGNTGSLVSLSSRSGQFPFGNQQGGSPSGIQQPLSPFAFPDSQPLGSPVGSGNQSFFGNQADFGDMNTFDSQQFPNPGFGGQQQFSNSGFGNQSQQLNPASGFGGQQQFSNPGFGNQQFNSTPGFVPQSQQFFQGSNPGFAPQPSNPNLLPSPAQQPGQTVNSRPRWPNAQEQNQ